MTLAVSELMERFDRIPVWQRGPRSGYHSDKIVTPGGISPRGGVASA